MSEEKKNENGINPEDREIDKLPSELEDNSTKAKSTQGLVTSISKAGGGEGLGDFDFNRFFGSVFRPHTEEEIEESLIVGTSTTTPSIHNISLEYPQPWLFFRLVSASVILFYGFVFSYNSFQNPKLLPGLIITGSFAVPISTLFLFFELNIRRNVPIWQIIRLVFFGGILSLFSALILFSNTSFLASLGAAAAGPIEEPAKLAALVALMQGKRKFPYILNGLLLGAAVGCGFAAFESAGYALETLIQGGNINNMINIIQLRGVLSPFMHIVWTSIAGAALWRVQRGGPFYFNLVKTKEFYMPFGIAVGCHMFWNSEIGSSWPFEIHYIIPGLVAWIVALSHVNLGIKQLAKEKSGVKIFKD